MNQPSHNQPPRPPSVSGRGERRLAAGEVLFSEGQSGHEMYIIRSGKLRVLKQEGKSSIQLAVVGPGGVLGELSLLDNQPRGATVQAVEDVVASVIDRPMLETTLKTLPNWLANILVLLVKRLRDTMKKASEELAKRNADGFMRVLLLLSYSEGHVDNGELLLSLDLVKQVANSAMGVSGADVEAIVEVLSGRGLVSTRVTAQGGKSVSLGNRQALESRLRELRSAYHAGNT